MSLSQPPPADPPHVPGAEAGSGSRNAAPRGGHRYPATQRQGDLLRYIAGFQEAHGYSPCFRECAAGIGVAQTGKAIISRDLDGLESCGHIRRLANRHRAIEVLHAPPIPRGPEGAPLYFIPVSQLPHASGDRT